MQNNYKDFTWLKENLIKYKTPNIICKNTGCSETSIRRYIKKYQLEYLIDKTIKLKKEEDFEKYPYKKKEWLIKQIKKYNTIIEICCKTGYASTSVRRYIKLFGLESMLERPKSKRVHSLLEDYFEKIDTQEKAYWLGLLVADGNVRSIGNRYCIRLCLKGEDRYLIERLKEDIGSSSNIYIDKFNRATIRVFSKKMFTDLSNLGVVPNKTGKEIFPEISEKLISHFVRGFFDGDGTIYRRKNRNRHKCTVGFCCQNEEFVIQMNKVIKEYCSFEMPYYEHKNNVYEAKTESFQNCISFVEWIYKDANIAMLRKYYRSNEYLNYYCPSLKEFEDATK